MDKAELTNGAIVEVRVGTYNRAEVLLPSVGVAPASLSLPPREKF